MTRRMLAWVVYPATMTGAFGVHAALQSAGVPILAAAYVAVTLAAGAVTLFEFAIPYDRGWQPALGRTSRMIFSSWLRSRWCSHSSSDWWWP